MIFARKPKIRDGEASGQTKGISVIPNPSDSIDPLSPTAEPPERARRRRWWLGGGARRDAGALRPVERDLRPSTAPAGYGEAS